MEGRAWGGWVPASTTGHRLMSKPRAMALLGDGLRADRSTPAFRSHCPPALRAPWSPTEMPKCRQQMHRSQHPSATPSVTSPGSAPSPAPREGRGLWGPVSTAGPPGQPGVGTVQLKARWTSWSSEWGLGWRHILEAAPEDHDGHAPGSCETLKLRAAKAEKGRLGTRGAPGEGDGRAASEQEEHAASKATGKGKGSREPQRPGSSEAACAGLGGERSGCLVAARPMPKELGAHEGGAGCREPAGALPPRSAGLSRPGRRGDVGLPPPASYLSGEWGPTGHCHHHQTVQALPLCLDLPRTMFCVPSRTQRLPGHE